MRLPLLGPSDLVHGVGVVRDGIGEAIEALPRLLALLDQAETLIGRVGQVVDKIEATIDRADILIGGVTSTYQAAQQVVTSVEETAVRANSLLGLYEDPLRTMAPKVSELAASIEPTEVHAMVQLVDRLPMLLKHLDEDVVPILTTLDRVAPDLHQLLEIAQDLQVALGGVPGMGWLRKRAEKEEDEAEQEARVIEAATGKPPGKPKGSRSAKT
ncbi:MAG: ribulose 1,5-bisphosphate carboxylase large subunit [Actinomycetota bacterium]|nr:ribulose 1,5-bisphosphate carboxylase large subunit [Actinomycetota bacterium]